LVVAAGFLREVLVLVLYFAAPDFAEFAELRSGLAGESA